VLEPGKDTFSVSTVKIAYDLHWADLTSISSYAYRSFPRTTDGTYFNSQFVDILSIASLGYPVSTEISTAIGWRRSRARSTTR